MGHSRQVKNFTIKQNPTTGLDTQKSGPFKKTVFVASHFFIGWMVINKGLLFINKLALTFFIFGWLIWVFLIFDFIKLEMGTKGKELNMKKEDQNFFYFLSKESFRNLLMFISLLAVLFGIIFSINTNFLRFK